MDSSTGAGRAAFGGAAFQRVTTHFYSSGRDRRPPRVSETFFYLPGFVRLRCAAYAYDAIFGGLPRHESGPVYVGVHFRLYDRSHAWIFVLGNRDHSEHERVRWFESAGPGRKHHDYRFG